MPSVTSPQVCNPPAARLVNVRPPLTTIGEVRGQSEVPSPIWPKKFAPQQYVVPSLTNPHVCPPPATRLVKVFSPVTGTGEVRGQTEVPSPIWPDPLSPQQ